MTLVWHQFFMSPEKSNIIHYNPLPVNTIVKKVFKFTCACLGNVRLQREPFLALAECGQFWSRLRSFHWLLPYLIAHWERATAFGYVAGSLQCPGRCLAGGLSSKGRQKRDFAQQKTDLLAFSLSISHLLSKSLTIVLHHGQNTVSFVRISPFLKSSFNHNLNSEACSQYYIYRISFYCCKIQLSG